MILISINDNFASEQNCLEMYISWSYRRQVRFVSYSLTERWTRRCILHDGCRHQMETFSALLAVCAGNSPVPCEFPSQRPVTRSFGVFFDLRLNKRLSKQSQGWWFETSSRPLWRQCNVKYTCHVKVHMICRLPWNFIWNYFFSPNTSQSSRNVCEISVEISMWLYFFSENFIRNFVFFMRYFCNYMGSVSSHI